MKTLQKILKVFNIILLAGHGCDNMTAILIVFTN